MSPSPNPAGQVLLYLAISLVVQTLFFGGYTVIIILSTRNITRRGMKAHQNRILLFITLFMYMLSAAYWAYRTADFIARIRFPNPQDQTPVTRWFGLFNAFIGINFLLCDGVVIWRARLICSPDHRKYLYLPLFFLSLTAVAVAGVIGLRIASSYSISFESSTQFTEAIDIIQVSGVSMSLISNLSSTGVVGITAWRHREAIRVFRKTTTGDQILRILLESGVLYCIAGLFGLASPFIKLPYNTLGDMYTPVNMQIAGAYTPIVVLLASTQKSLSDTSFLGSIPDSDSVEIHVREVSPIVSNHTVHDTMQFGTRAVGLMENENKKSHRYHTSDTTLV
ncbi:hypothetical protein B0H19DRAFT_1094410 [Mycena capillaripes]|nr:hypothetical protein B0H19DRAFT_1094410 [Mycena capillaripes]